MHTYKVQQTNALIRSLLSTKDTALLTFMRDTSRIEADRRGLLMSPVQDAAHVVVLDDFFGEAERESLLHSLTGSEGGSCSSSGPSGSKWERNTADGAHAARTWGLREDALTELTANPTPAILEIQTRLVSSAPCRSPPLIHVHAMRVILLSLQDRSRI